MFIRSLAMASSVLLSLGAANAQQAPAELHTLHVQGSVYMITGDGGNVTVQIGNDGILLVDTGLAQNADRLLAEVRKLSTAPIRYIINTHVHPDHVGGNEKIGTAGSAIAGGNFAGDIADAGVGANIIAHINVLNRISMPSGNQPAPPAKAWPTDTYLSNKKKIFFNGEAIEIIHVPSAHTDGDSLVFFRRSDVISTGDLLVTTSFPIVDLDRGGNIQGVVAALNRFIDISVPADKQEGGTYLIPGHGRLCDQADVVEIRDMTTIIRDRIQDGVKKNLTLEQVKAGKPTLDYPVYNSSTGFWTTDRFIDAVYQSLRKEKK
ncbi:MAG TPA: MBL fold metallo-hydrolase [Bryobacteraceae bacterium]|nr:MBL fold metallo-hydrolase [Bryobacteraceae bacterium]